MNKTESNYSSSQLVGKRQNGYSNLVTGKGSINLLVYIYELCMRYMSMYISLSMCVYVCV